MYANQHEQELETAETDLAMEAAGDNDNLIDLIGIAAESKLRAGFIAGYKVAVQLAAELAKAAKEVRV